MSRKPLVSIIIPTYKRPTMLKRAVDSVLSQTYENIEVIIVSDNNIDDEFENETKKLIQTYSTDPRVIYLPGDGNHGGCFARNRGLERASGEYVNFLDDDDSFFPSKIEKQIKVFLERPELAVVSCYGAIVNAKGRTYRYEKTQFDTNNILYCQLLGNLGTTSLNLINTEICRKVGGFTYIESSQEHLFLLRIFAISPFFAQVQEVLATIYQHDGARVSNNKKRPVGTLKMTKIIESYYDRLTADQIKKVKLSRYKVDSLAYAQLGEKKKSWNLFLARCSLSLFDLDNIKLLIKLVTGKVS